MFLYFTGIINFGCWIACCFIGDKLVNLFINDYWIVIKFLAVALLVIIGHFVSSGIIMIIGLKKDNKGLLITKWFQKNWYKEFDTKPSNNFCIMYKGIMKDLTLVSIIYTVLTIITPFIYVFAFLFNLLIGNFINPFKTKVFNNKSKVETETFFTFSPIWYIIPALFFLGQGSEYTIDSHPQVFIEGFKVFLIIFWGIVMIGLAKTIFIITDLKITINTEGVWPNKISPVISTSYRTIKDSLCPLIGLEE